MRFLCSLIAATILFGGVAQAKDDVIIFLHNTWYEKNKEGQSYPKFGVYDFEGIKQALAKGGRVIALERGSNANPKVEAGKLAMKVRDLISEGISSERIKVIGASKGAFIAQLASVELNDVNIRWVLVGGCHITRMQQGNIPAMTGVVLSLHEKSDKVAGACMPYGELAKNAAKFQEVTLATDQDHGFQFAPSDAWIVPAVDW